MLVPRMTVCIIVAACVCMSVEASQMRRSKSQPAKSAGLSRTQQSKSRLRNRAVGASRIAAAPRIRKVTTKSTPDILEKLATVRAEEKEKYERSVSGLRVMARSGLDQESRNAHTQAKDVLERVNYIPQARIAHFDWLNARQFPVKGWSGSIEEAAPIANGLKVKLRVSPFSGSGLQYADHVFEYYAIVNNQIQFLGLEPGSPEGMRYNWTIQ